MINQGLRIVCLGGLLIAVAARCLRADAPQRASLPADVVDVYIDAQGRAIREMADGDFRASAEAIFAGRADLMSGAHIILIDAQKRIWLRPTADKEHTTIEMFDGKTWLTRTVADIPANANRNLAGIHFVGAGVQDAAGHVWFVDGNRSQGWWIHHYTPQGKWDVKVLHERTFVTRAGTRPTLKFADPQIQIGPDGLFYTCWSSSRTDGGSGLGASGFLQFDGSTWNEYFYPTGSNESDSVQRIIPFPDGSVGFVRIIDEPRVVWMSSALSRPTPDLKGYINRLTSLSARQRDAAAAELTAMGPRVRNALQKVLNQTDDPELKSRLPVILDEISRPPSKGVYGGRYSFTAWRFLDQAKSGRVYLAVQNCKDRTTNLMRNEALVTISPIGVWSAADSPIKRLGQSIGKLDLCEDDRGRRWYRLAGQGVFLDDSTGQNAPRPMGLPSDGTAMFRGVDSTGKMYLLGTQGVIVLDPAKSSVSTAN